MSAFKLRIINEEEKTDRLIYEGNDIKDFVDYVDVYSAEVLTNIDNWFIGNIFDREFKFSSIKNLEEKIEYA